MSHIDKRADIELDHLYFTLTIEFHKLIHRTKPGVIDKHVDLEIAFLYFLKQTSRGIRIRQVERDILRANAAHPSKLITNCDQFVFRTCDEDDVTAKGCKLSSESRTDSARGTCY